MNGDDVGETVVITDADGTPIRVAVKVAISADDRLAYAVYRPSASTRRMRLHAWRRGGTRPRRHP